MTFKMAIRPTGCHSFFSHTRQSMIRSVLCIWSFELRVVVLCQKTTNLLIWTQNRPIFPLGLEAFQNFDRKEHKTRKNLDICLDVCIGPQFLCFRSKPTPSIVRSSRNSEKIGQVERDTYQSSRARGHSQVGPLATLSTTTVTPPPAARAAHGPLAA
jgi:hypothetical protein